MSQVIVLQLIRCQGAGPSTFGYDASSACSKPYSRAGRSHHEDLPCDFRRQNWCTIAGSSYPWYFVHLRFVFRPVINPSTIARGIHTTQRYSRIYVCAHFYSERLGVLADQKEKENSTNLDRSRSYSCEINN